MTRAAAAFGQTRSALAGAAREAREAWGPIPTVAVVVVAAAALLPAIAPASLGYQRLAPGVYLALAAVGLGVTVGLAGMPSLAQGAFVAVGAFTFALLRARAGWPVVGAVVAATIVAAGAGLLFGALVARLRGALVAVTTWVLAWLVAFTLTAFPALSGGARGLVLPAGTVGGLELTPTAHYEIGLALLVLAIGGFWVVSRGPGGVALAALRQDADAAVALGVPAERLRLGAFAASALVAGLAGALAVDLAGVADPASYGPLLSFELFIAVLLGGATSPLGGLAGVVVLGLLARLTGTGALEGQAVGRVQTLLASLIVLTLLGFGVRGLVPWLTDLRGSSRPKRPETGAGSARVTPPSPRAAGPPLLEARDLRKSFGDLVAVADVELELAPASIHALAGPNGSGKTTVLKLLSGALSPDAGEIVLAGRRIDAESLRARALAGIVTTLQSTSVFGDSTVLDNALVGAGLRRRYAGTFRTLAATPLHRADSEEARAKARRALDLVDLGWAETMPARLLSRVEQRLLMIASALATEPRALLLDEPAAGAGPQDLEHLTSILHRLRANGVAVLLAEHNLRLVGAVADRMTVLAGGSVVESGEPGPVLDSASVQEAYLGRRGG